MSEKRIKDLERRIKQLEQEGERRLAVEKALHRRERRINRFLSKSSGEKIIDPKGALSLNETRFRDISLSMADWIWEVDKEGKYTYSAGNIKEITGYEPKEILGKTPFDFMPAGEAERIGLQFEEILSKKKPIVDLVNWNLKKDGTPICLLTNGVPFFDAEGELSGYRGVDKDITVQYQTEKALRENETRHRTIMDTCADPIVVYDLKGRVTYLNPAFTKIFGWTHEELLGKRIDFVPAEAEAETQEAIKKVLAEKTLTGFESRRFSKTGKMVDVRIGAALIHDESDVPSGMVINFQDITLQKQIVLDLEMAKNKAEEASRAKSDFLANMSHEIRTPMNGIIGMTELTLAMDLTPEQHEYLTMVKMSADALLSLINDILDFSKIEAGKLELESIDFNLCTLLENVADTLALKAHEKGLELISHMDPEVPAALIGDPGRIRQIIVNLVGNALKFTESGEIVIKAEIEAEREDSVQLHFIVSDTGIGIPPHKLDTIFQSFEQADMSTTRKYGGTGLGLAISQQLVALMDGKIWVESPGTYPLDIYSDIEDQHPHSEGPGSIFHFTACFGLGRSKKKVPVQHSRKSLYGLRVLIVDDNYTNRRLLRDILLGWKLAPETAENGRNALDLLEKAFRSGTSYDLVLLDMQMPEMDGFSVAKIIKSAVYGTDVKIIMISSLGMRGDSARCKEIGISGYLTKPVKQSELLDSILMVTGSSVENRPRVITRHTVYEERKRLNILLAEDNKVNQMLAVKLLEKRGHHVTLASNGKEAVALVEQGDFDLIFMDIQMPEMDGFEATRAIHGFWFGNGKTKKQIKAVPIVAMTAHAMKGDREKCYEAGMDEYISKPIKPKALYSVIDKVMIE